MASNSIIEEWEQYFDEDCKGDGYECIFCGSREYLNHSPGNLSMETVKHVDTCPVLIAEKYV